MKEKYITKEELLEKFGNEICEHCSYYNMGKRKIAVTNYATNLKMKLQCN